MNLFSFRLTMHFSFILHAHFASQYYLVAKKERTLWCNKQELFYLCLGIYSNGQYIYAKLIGIYLFSHKFSRDYLNEIKHI
jgi:hypothetical protein